MKPAVLDGGVVVHFIQRQTVGAGIVVAILGDFPAGELQLLLRERLQAQAAEQPWPAHLAGGAGGLHVGLQHHVREARRRRAGARHVQGAAGHQQRRHDQRRRRGPAPGAGRLDLWDRFLEYRVERPPKGRFAAPVGVDAVGEPGVGTDFRGHPAGAVRRQLAVREGAQLFIGDRMFRVAIAERDHRSLLT